MKSSILGCAVLLSSTLLGACGGVSNIGSSDRGSSNAGRGGFEPFGGFNGEGAAGAANHATGGYSAGAASGTGATGRGGAFATGGASTTRGGASSAGDAGATSAGGAASVRLCKYDIECLGFGDECQHCADGGYACDSFCVNGSCLSKPAGCPATCASDAECAVHDFACISCDDGEHCPTSRCQMGICRTSKPVCGITDNCVGYPCSSPCKLCDANGCAEDYTSFCNDDGVCEALPTHCGTAKCASNADCGAPPPMCSPCGDGSCAKFGCFNNECKLSCGGTGPICKYAEECAGLGTECKLCPSGKCAVHACIQNGCALVCPL